MDFSIINALICGLQAIIVAVVAGVFNRDAKKRKQEHSNTEKRAAQRAKESLLAMKMMSANSSLAIATALAIKEGNTNGKLEYALAEAEAAQREYFAFVNNLASQKLNQ
jgi:predicted GIY-YIG superfamily endonuclease